jgi:hypothetical protein
LGINEREDRKRKLKSSREGGEEGRGRTDDADIQQWQTRLISKEKQESILGVSV